MATTTLFLGAPPATVIPRTAAKLEQPLVPEQPQRSQHGVRVYPEYGSEVACGREAFAGLGLAVGDRSADVDGHLVVQQGRVGSVHLDAPHSAVFTIASVLRLVRVAPLAINPGLVAGGVIDQARWRQRRRRLAMAAVLFIVGVLALAYVGSTHGYHLPGHRQAVNPAGDSGGVVARAR